MLHKPCVVALLETQVESARAKSLLHSTHQTGMVVVEAGGYSGGIWVLWDSSAVQVELVVAHEQILTVLVEGSMHRLPWLLFIIYASPQPNVRENLWHYLRELGSLVRIPWVVAGDCN